MKTLHPSAIKYSESMPRMLAPVSLALFVLLAMMTFTQPAHALTIGMQAENQMQLHDVAQRDLAWNRLDKNGAKVVRMALLWNEVVAGCTLQTALSDPLQTCYNWSKYDTLAQEADQKGIQIMFSIIASPAWANGNESPVFVGADPLVFESFLVQYANFAKNAALRYPQVKLWTIWNEPNGGHFFQPMSASAPHRYARMVYAAAASMKSVRSDLKIAIGPTAPSAAGGIKPKVYLPILQKELQTLGAGGLIDAVAHNPYPTTGKTPYYKKAGGDNLGLGKINDLVKVLDKSPVTRNKPIWATEVSYETAPSDPRGISEARQAQYLPHVFWILHNQPRVKIALWYVLQDPKEVADWQSGLYRSSGKAKPSALMFARPIAAKKSGMRILIWGKSNVAKKSVLMYSANGKKWAPIKGQKMVRGAQIGSLPKKAKGFVRLVDNKGKGPIISVKAAL